MSARPSRSTVRVAIAILATAALLALTALALAAVSNPKGGSYKGATSQGKQIKFKVVGRTVMNPQFSLRSPPCTGTFYIYDTDRVDRNGRFDVSSTIAEVRGRFVTRTKAKGTATGEFQGCPGGTKTVGYTARRK